MSLDDIRLTETVDLAERVKFLREDRIPAAEDRITEAEQADDPDPTADELRGLKDRLEGQADAMERVVNALGGGAFAIQELMTAETALLQDDVAEQAIDVDYDREEVSGTPKKGYHKVRTLQLSIVDAPEAMDTEYDSDLGRDIYQVGKLPDLVSDYLYACVTALNESGSVDGVQDFSDSLGVPDGN